MDEEFAMKSHSWKLAERCLESLSETARSRRNYILFIFVFLEFHLVTTGTHLETKKFRKNPKSLQTWPVFFFGSLRMDFLVHSVCSFMAGLEQLRVVCFFQVEQHMSNGKQPGCLRDIWGMTNYPVMWGLFHKP